jgi:cytochrome P450
VTLLRSETRTYGGPDIDNTHPGRDPELLSQLSNYAQTALPNALLIRLFPPILQDKIGGLIRAWRIRRYHHSLFETLVPPITKLLQESQQQDKSWADEQGSFASWWLREAIDLQNDKAMDPAILAAIIIQLNFAGLHSTSLTTTNALYHILSYENSEALVEDLRREMAESSASATTGDWTWAALEKMTLLDSVVRESDGLHLSPGTRVCVPGYLANVDEQHYADASTFEPYRFVKSNGTTGHERAWAVTDNFTTFGHGLHVSTANHEQSFLGTEPRMYC